MKIGIFVGSFNPVHKGHIKIVNYILENKFVDKILIIPTGNYWNKNNIIEVKHRIKMLENYETEKIIIERELNNLPYTYLIIRKLKERYKYDELFLIMGADNIISFDKWMNYEELLKLNFIIYKRNNVKIEKYLKKLNKLDNTIIIKDTENINISSSDIRKTINNYLNLKNLLDKNVLNYIINNNLYD